MSRVIKAVKKPMLINEEMKRGAEERSGAMHLIGRCLLSKTGLVI